MVASYYNLIISNTGTDFDIIKHKVSAMRSFKFHCQKSNLCLS